MRAKKKPFLFHAITYMFLYKGFNACLYVILVHHSRAGMRWIPNKHPNSKAKKGVILLTFLIIIFQVHF